MSGIPQHVVVCNGASGSPANERPLRLEYRREERGRNVKLNLPDFARSVVHIRPRLLDLIEIATYVHAGDRLVRRGDHRAVEYHGWARSFLYRIKVRDFDFWSRPEVGRALAEAATFMTGDRVYQFEFEAGHRTPQTSLFDSEEFQVAAGENAAVALFSGGLDSLVGVLWRLSMTKGDVYLVSHAANSGVQKTQRELARALQERYGERVRHYRFSSHLHRVRAQEETQRIRSFLFCSIAYAIAHSIGLREVYLFENGITGINIPKRQSLMNARASRTTHPKTVGLLERLFSLIEGQGVVIRNPLLYHTKTDVIKQLRDLGHADLYSSAISCGVARSKKRPKTHCGACNQCIDRRFAAFAAGLKDYDGGKYYEQDFVAEGLTGDQMLKSLVDYMRQAERFREASVVEFLNLYINDISELAGFLPDVSEDHELEVVQKVYALCDRHGEQVLQGYQAMLSHRTSLAPPTAGSAFSIAEPGDHFSLPFDPKSLIDRLDQIESGKEGAKAYEEYMEEVLPILFEPDLTNLKRQVANEERKGIVDITMRLAAESGFWALVRSKWGNVLVPIEVKNKKRLGNGDFNQAVSRLTPAKGRFGVLIGRRVESFDVHAIRPGIMNQQMVAPLGDDDIATMLRMRACGKSPADHIAERVRDILERIG